MVENYDTNISARKLKRLRGKSIRDIKLAVSVFRLSLFV